MAKQSNICIEVDEEKIPVCDEVKGICEMLGFEAKILQMKELCSCNS